MAKGPIKYNDLFLADVSAGIAKLQKDFQILDQISQGLAKSLTGSNVRIKVSIDETKTARKDLKKDLNDIDISARGAGEAIDKMAKTAEQSSKNLNNFENQSKDLNNVFNLTTASVDEVKTRISLLTKEYYSLGRATDQDKEKTKALASEIVRLKTEQSNLIGALKQTKVAVEAADGSYREAALKLTRLRKELMEMPKAINKTTGEWDKANPAVAKHLAQIEKLDVAVKRFDAGMGNYQRNVGNYASGFNPLNASIVQLSRELPSLAQSFQMFTLAISNNIGPLQDAIGGINAQNKALIAQGKPTTSVLKQIGSALFSWTTALNIGVTLLVVFGKEIGVFVAGLFKVKKALDEITESQLNLNEAFKSSEYKDAVRDVTSLEVSIAQAKKGFIEKSAVVVEYNRTLGQTLGTVKNFEEVEKSITANGEAYIRMMLARAAANISLEKAALAAVRAEETRLKKDKDILTGVDNSKVFSAAGSAPGFVPGQSPNAGIRLQAQLAKERRDQQVKDAEAEKNLQQKIAADFIKNASIEAEKMGIAGNIFAENQSNLLTGSKQKITDQVTENAKVGFEILREEIQRLEIELERGLIDGVVDSTDRKLAEQFFKLRTHLETLIKLRDDLLNPASFAPIDSASSVGITQSDPSTDPLIPFPAASDVKDKSEAYIEAIESAVDSLRESNYLISEAFGYETGNLFDELADNLENFLNHSGNSFEDCADTASAAVRSINEQVSLSSEARIAQFEKEKENDLKIAGDNKAAQAIIEANFNKKVTEEKRKQAKTAKAAAMFEIAINTAVAATKVTAQTGLFGLPLVPLIIGLGAVQLALVAAQPLPGFWKGTDNAPTGFAELAERGPEMVIDKKTGRKRLIKDHSIGYLRGGEQVLDAPNTEKYLSSLQIDQETLLHGTLSQRVSDARMNEQIAAINASKIDEDSLARKMGIELGRQIAAIPINNIALDERGFTRSIRKGNSTVTLINNKNSL